MRRKYGGSLGGLDYETDVINAMRSGDVRNLSEEELKAISDRKKFFVTKSELGTIEKIKSIFC